MEKSIISLTPNCKSLEKTKKKIAILAPAKIKKSKRDFFEYLYNHKTIYFKTFTKFSKYNIDFNINFLKNLVILLYCDIEY